MDQFDKYDTAFDPCPTCGTEVDGWESNAEYVRSNPEAVSSIRDPECPHETDPDAECTCTLVINPAPNPALDRYTPVANWVTLKPCGHVFEASQLSDLGWEIRRTLRPGWHQEQLDKLLADAAAHGVDLSVKP